MANDRYKDSPEGYFFPRSSPRCFRTNLVQNMYIITFEPQDHFRSCSNIGPKMLSLGVASHAGVTPMALEPFF